MKRLKVARMSSTRAPGGVTRIASCINPCAAAEWRSGKSRRSSTEAMPAKSCGRKSRTIDETYAAVMGSPRSFDNCAAMSTCAVFGARCSTARMAAASASISSPLRRFLLPGNGSDGSASFRCASREYVIAGHVFCSSATISCRESDGCAAARSRTAWATGVCQRAASSTRPNNDGFFFRTS